MKKFIFLFILFFSCKPDKVFESEQTIKKCVITKYKVLPPKSTLDFEPKTIYYTDCGETLVRKNSYSYKIGDTITFVYKKFK